MIRIKEYSDEELIEMLKADQTRSKAIETIYLKTRLSVIKYVVKYWGTEDEALELINDSFFTLIKCIDENRFKGQSRLDVFFIGICKNKWRDEVKRQKKQRERSGEMKEEPGVFDIISDQLIKEENIKRLQKCLSHLEEVCSKIMKWRFYEDVPLEWGEIAAKLAYANAQVARNRGQRCMKKLREIYIQN